MTMTIYPTGAAYGDRARIDAAIASAKEGETVLLTSGPWFTKQCLGPIVIDKAIVFSGEPETRTEIRGEYCLCRKCLDSDAYGYGPAIRVAEGITGEVKIMHLYISIRQPVRDDV